MLELWPRSAHSLDRHHAAGSAGETELVNAISPFTVTAIDRYCIDTEQTAKWVFPSRSQ
jgi:hypothetical protein